MLNFILWAIEIGNIVLHAINILNCSDYIYSLSKTTDMSLTDGVVGVLEQSITSSVISIIVSLLFCMAITISYSRSKNNEKKIGTIVKIMVSKNLIDVNKINEDIEELLEDKDVESDKE